KIACQNRSKQSAQNLPIFRFFLPMPFAGSRECYQINKICKQSAAMNGSQVKCQNVKTKHDNKQNSRVSAHHLWKVSIFSDTFTAHQLGCIAHQVFYFKQNFNLQNETFSVVPPKLFC